MFHMKHVLSSTATTDFFSKNKEKLSNFFVKDFAVSGEDFELQYDANLFLYKTYPQPNPEDLNRYYESKNYISHTDANKNWFEKSYQFIKNIALKNKLNLINGLKTDQKKLLDIGAGTGDFLAYMNQNNWQTIGFEPNQNARNLAIAKGVLFANNLSDLAPSSFDVITLWHVLEHVSAIDEQIKTLQKLLKPNGVIVVAVPNFNSFDARYYGKFWAAFDVPRHLWHFSKTAIKLIFQKHNMEISKIYPMKFDAFYVSLLSEKYKTGKMNFLKAVYIGLRSNIKAKQNFEYSSLIYTIKNR